MTKSKRITVDLGDMPDVFERLKADAKASCRSLAGQLLFECLPSIAKTTFPRRTPKKKVRAA